MKKYISIIAAVFMVGVTGCKKDFLSLEVNPNSPSVSTPQYLLSGAEKIAADIVNDDYGTYGVWGGFWAPSGNYVPSPQVQQYQFTNANFNGSWGDLYANLTNFNNLQNQSADPSLANFKAIAMIMKVYDFQQLVDNYNDVPYSQAFQASVYLFPKYDKGAAIYADFFVQLDAAIALINANPSAVNPGSSDIVFGGTMASWKKFANTLKLRAAIRQSNIAAASTFTAELAKTSTEGYIDDTTPVTVNPGYSNLAGKESPFYVTYGFDNTGNASGGNQTNRGNDYFISMLQANNDPRISGLWTLTNIYPAQTPTVLVYHGNQFGNTSVFLANSYTSAIGAGLLKAPTQNAYLLSGSEGDFLLAEGVLNGYITSSKTAQNYYEAGITASFVQLGLTAAQATTYYTQGLANVGWAASGNKEQAIITQKWECLDGYNNLEAYNEYRRTGYPNLPSSVDPAAISSTLPSRIDYPQSETSTNLQNLLAEGTINHFTSKIFWAK